MGKLGYIARRLEEKLEVARAQLPEGFDINFKGHDKTVGYIKGLQEAIDLLRVPEQPPREVTLKLMGFGNPSDLRLPLQSNEYIVQIDHEPGRFLPEIGRNQEARTKVWIAVES